MDSIKSFSQRVADAVTMFTVSAICLVLLLFVAHGTVTKTYEQLITEKLLAQGQLVQSSLENFIRPGLPLRQYVGFQQQTDTMVKNDEMLDSMAVYDRDGEAIFMTSDSRTRALPPTDERSLQNDLATVRSNAALLQVVLPLRNKFERVGDLVVTVNRALIAQKVDSYFQVAIYVAMIAAVGFGILMATGWVGGIGQGSRRVAFAFAATYLCVAATIALTMVSVFSSGAQSKGRALADSLSQRLDDIVNFGLQLDQVEGLDEVLTEYRRLNPDVTAAGVTVNGRIVVHSDPAQIGRYWSSDPSTHEYKSDLTPPNHPRASSVVLSVPKAIVYWQVLRSVKNFAALFVASSLFAFLFMQVAQAIQQAMRSAENRKVSWQEIAALDLVKPIFFLAVFVDHLAYAFLPQFVNEIVNRQALPANYVAVPFMAYYLCFALALMPAGRYELRFGSRPLIIGGLMLTAVGFLMMAAVPTFEFVVIARSVTGIGQGMLFIGIQSFVLAKSAPEHRTKANTIIVFGFQAGMISGMAIGSLLVGQIAPIGVFLLGFLIAGIVVSYSLLVLPSNDRNLVVNNKQVSAGEIWREIGVMMRDAKFRRSILLIGIPAKAVLTGVVLFAMPLILYARGFAQEDIGQITMIYAASVIVSSMWAAKVADANSNTGAILSWGAILTAVGLATIAACGWSPIATMQQAQTVTTLLTVTGICLIGVAHGLINAPVVTHVTQTAVAERSGSSQVGAAYRFMERAGHTLGPIIMGQLFVQVGVSYVAFAWVALAILVLGILFLISSRNEQSENSIRPEYA